MRFVLFLLVLVISATAMADSLLGLPVLSIPDDNPQTEAKIALGRQLFNDKRLSADGAISCASCHQADKAFSDGLPLAKGINGQLGTRNTPAVQNAAYYQSQFLDGRAASLEQQALGPLLNPIEHGLKDPQAIIDILQNEPDYSAAFSRVFAIQSGELTVMHVQKAIASFERTLISGNSAFDRYHFAMEQTAISAGAVRGSRIFRRKGNCLTCHEISMKTALFTDNRFYNIGVGMRNIKPVIEAWKQAVRQHQPPDTSSWSDAQRAELGRYSVTGRLEDIGKFKTPILRNVALTAPYMHDGSLQTLEQVIDHYDKGGEGNEFVDAKIFPLHLTEQEKSDLVEFLKSLTSLD
ncbi:MAG: c-type cytochrome [Methylomonas sp.]|jgi:cytochrome c peroxidase|uniref:cytochrome-c peroxidase n=1 Tax=Methylomonas sp. TaxID=418 RepID=UPI0025D9F6DD|nr:cytochrome c peroxidase [Methylomonas sp.]MCK9605722.1 c-type cytochrome [Methylomonas sp.]